MTQVACKQDSSLKGALSVLGKLWHIEDVADHRVIGLAQKLQLPEIIARLLVLRGVDGSQAEDFLTPTLRKLLPHPFLLKDLEKSAKRVVTAIMKGERIAIFGDYDVDGATSSALLYRFFSHFGMVPTLYIPDRFKEGYGPNVQALEHLAKDHQLLLTVDCGTTAFEAIEAGTEAGLDIIILDHHISEPHLPKAYGVINPNRLDETSELTYLAAVGVAYLFICGVHILLKEQNFYQDNAPDLLRLLDVVALGTVCDMVPLKGLNRAFVTQGLKVMERRENLGLRLLYDQLNLNQKPTPYHLGFLLGPRVNAGGRVGLSSSGVRLLTTNEISEAEDLAAKLSYYNQERQTIEALIVEEAVKLIETRYVNNVPHVLILAEENWHQGVIGIVASRMVERYHRPAVIISIEEGVGKGSARSIKGFDIGAALIAAKQHGLLIKGGGHAMAAGLSVAVDKIADLQAFLQNRFIEALGDTAPQATLALDGYLELHAINLDFYRTLEQLSPYGMGNHEPKFIVPHVEVTSCFQVGEAHLRCRLENTRRFSVEAIAFRVKDTPLEQALLSGKPLNIAGTLRENHWQGKSTLQLQIIDAMYA